MTGRDVRPAGSGVKLTYDDFVLFPDDGMRHELIDGEHFVTPSPNIRHQAIVGVLHALIWQYLDERPIGHVFYAPLDVVFTRFDVVEPDILYVSRERAQRVLAGGQNVQGVPNLVVDVASPSTRRRDETLKHELYERAGCDEYWFVDPDVDSIRVYRRDGDHFAEPKVLSQDAGDVLTSPLLPGLIISLARVFRG